MKRQMGLSIRFEGLKAGMVVCAPLWLDLVMALQFKSWPHEYEL